MYKVTTFTFIFFFCFLSEFFFKLFLFCLLYFQIYWMNLSCLIVMLYYWEVFWILNPKNASCTLLVHVMWQYAPNWETVNPTTFRECFMFSLGCCSVFNYWYFIINMEMRVTVLWGHLYCPHYCLIPNVSSLFESLQWIFFFRKHCCFWKFLVTIFNETRFQCNLPIEQ